MSENKIRAYRGTKFFKYLDPISLTKIKTILEDTVNLERLDYDLDSKIKISVKSPIKELDLTANDYLRGVIYYKKREKDNNSDSHHWKFYPVDFLFCKEPSVLILHGPISMMKYVIKNLDKTIHGEDDNNDKPPSDNTPESPFHPYGNNTPIGKSVIKKIVKAIENSNT